MNPFDKNQLLESLAQYGYSLMKPGPRMTAEAVLEGLAKQDDVRLAEGFPVVFANALRQKKTLDWESSDWNPRSAFSREDFERLSGLVALSQLLFELYAFDKKLRDRVSRLLSKVQGELLVKKFEAPFLNSGSVTVAGLKFSTERLKNNFARYGLSEPGLNQVLEKRHELELELVLSELFTARQKELLRKRLARKPFTKTEREYFYRVVKKRLKALANDELHQLAKQLVYS